MEPEKPLSLFYPMALPLLPLFSLRIYLYLLRDLTYHTVLQVAHVRPPESAPRYTTALGSAPIAYVATWGV